MLKSIIVKASLTFSLIASVFLASAAQAGEGLHKHHEKHNVVDRKTERVKTDNGFTRTTTKTDAAGETASRQAEVVRDKAAGTRTKTVSGTTFEGKSYSGQVNAQKTENGYTSQGEFTRPNGKTVERDVNAVVDRSAGTVTKTISTTPEGGETSTKTVTHELKRNK